VRDGSGKMLELFDCRAWANPIKSSMYTSSSFANFSLSILSFFGSSNSVGIHKSSNGCSGRGVVQSSNFCAISHAVSAAVQKKGGDSHHPLWRSVGFMIWIGSSSDNRGST